MEPILFYGVPEGSSFGSIVALEWSGQPYKLCRIRMPEDVTSDKYKRLNPRAETPAMITEDGYAISESVAILHHLGARVIDKKLAFRQGTEDFDRFNQVICFLNTDFYDSFATLWYAFEHDLDESGKETLTATGRDKVQKAHADLDVMIGDSKWLMGDQRTLADAYFFGIARWTDFHKVLSRSDYPNIHRLYEKMKEDPAVRFAHAIEHEEPATSTGGFAGQVSLDDALRLMKKPA
jgi:glutathione S-transferase